METIATHTLFIKMFGDREMISNVGMPPMECRIEAGNLRKARIVLQKRSDRRKIVGLMQGGKRDVVLQLLNDRTVDKHGSVIFGTAVNNAVTHRDGI